MGSDQSFAVVFGACPVEKPIPEICCIPCQASAG